MITPLDLIELIAPPEASISTSISAVDNTQMTVNWAVDAFRGQDDVDRIRIETNPNDGSCYNRAGGIEFCEIPVSSSASGEHVITNLTPGRGYELDFIYF